MIEKLQGIILSVVRHNDRTVIANVYTPTHGRLPLLISTGSGKNARLQAARTMLLSQLEFSVRFSRVRELHRPSALSVAYPYRDIYFNPAKSTIAFFLADFLNRLLRDATPDATTYRFLSESLIFLDNLPASPSNFHLTFMAQLTSFMGIAPDLDTYRPGYLFDMRAGRYTGMLPGHSDILTGSDARVPLFLSRLTFGNMHRLRLNRNDRSRLIKGLLHYWSLHFPGIESMRSPDILTLLFE